jgi:hypothetical protein
MNQVDLLINTPTLAPIREFYQYNNLRNMEAQTLASIAKSSITSIEASIDSLAHLIENLKIYKQCMLDSINLQAESADTGKYTVSTPSQSHTLPGIISIPQNIKSGSERIEQIKTDKEKALRQKRIYLRLVEKDSRLYFQSLKGLQHSDASFEEFLEILNNNIDLSLQPNRSDDRSSRMKPNIKLSVSQEL